MVEGKESHLVTRLYGYYYLQENVLKLTVAIHTCKYAGIKLYTLNG